MTQQSEKPTLPSPAAADAAALDGKLAATLRGAARELNSGSRPAAAIKQIDRANDLPHFVNLSRRLGDALIENAEAQVTRAQNNLEEMRSWVENMQAEAQTKWEEQQTLERKFEDYRSYIIQANDKFNGGK